MITYDIAKKYLDKGMSIFPVILSKDKDGKIQKRPAVAWKQYITRLPTEEELHIWFDHSQFNGIGMATGKISNLNVLDIEGYATEEVIKKFDSPLKTRTISGGYHLFYKWDHPIRNSVKIEGEAVDFRGDGGFVVLPPSGFEGNKYSWETKQADFSLLKQLPSEVESSLTKKTPILQNTDLTSDGIFPIALPGERNMTAAKVAGTMVAKIPETLWDSNGWPGFVAWNKLNPDPLDLEELKTVWESITATEKSKNGTEDMFNLFEGDKAVKEYDRLQEEFGGGIPTGHRELDEFFNFQPQQVYLISAITHTGKCFAPGTRVLMYNGTVKKIEDIKPGEKIMGDDITPRTVLSLASGTDEMYEVRQSYAKTYTVNSAHILCLKSTDTGKEITMNVVDYINKNEDFKKEYFGYKRETVGVFAGVPIIASETSILSKLDIKPVGMGKYHGFIIDGNHKFLLDDGTVVHNTTFALELSARVASFGYKVLFASLEQGVFIAPRIPAMIGGDYPADLNILTSQKLVSTELLVKYISTMERKPDLLVIDHLHFMKKTGAGVTDSIDNMMIDIQNMAKELSIPVVIIAHMRKLNENRRPTMDDLRDSSSLQQIPSVVMLLHRPILPRELMDEYGMYLDPYTDLIIAKNRIQGKTGGINFIFEKDGSIKFISKAEAKAHADELESGIYTKEPEPKKFGQRGIFGDI